MYYVRKKGSTYKTRYKNSKIVICVLSAQSITAAARRKISYTLGHQSSTLHT